MTVKGIEEAGLGPDDNLEVDGQMLSEIAIVGRALIQNHVTG